MNLIERLECHFVKVMNLTLYKIKYCDEKLKFISEYYKSNF